MQEVYTPVVGSYPRSFFISSLQGKRFVCLIFTEIEKRSGFKDVKFRFHCSSVGPSVCLSVAGGRASRDGHGTMTSTRN